MPSNGHQGLVTLPEWWRGTPSGSGRPTADLPDAIKSPDFHSKANGWFLLARPSAPISGCLHAAMDTFSPWQGGEQIGPGNCVGSVATEPTKSQFPF